MGFLTRTRLSTLAYITDTGIHAPPTTGLYAYSPPYGTFTPDDGSFPAVGATYVDPVFGGTIRRLTDNGLTAGTHSSDIYGKNGWWNADGTYFVNTMADGTSKAINSTTGAQKSLTGLGGGVRNDASCSPIDPDEYLYFSTTNLIAQSIDAGTTATVKNFGTTLNPLGGTMNWIDLSGRYYVVNLGSPSFRVWDRQTDTLFTGAITAAIGTGYVCMAPDASYVIHVNGTAKKRHAIDTGAQTLAASGTTFYTGGGDHAAVVLASDGEVYFVRLDNSPNPSLLKRIHVATGTVVDAYTLPGDGISGQTDPYWTSQPDHYSGVSRGAWQDWVFFSSEFYYAGSGSESYVALDGFDGADPVATWNKMQNEIFAINILTFELRRFAHHRSRELLVYNHIPRVCASWGGEKVAWASNYGYESAPAGYADIYCLIN